MERKSFLAVFMLISLSFSAICQSPGTLDPDFGVSGVVFTDFENAENYIQAAIVHSNGRILVCGYTGYGFSGTICNLAQYLENGTPDPAFSNNGKVSFSLGGSESIAYDMCTHPDGRIYVAGVTGSGPDSDIAIACFSPDGVLYESFGTAGVVITDLGHNETTNSIILQNDGKIVVCGHIYYGSSNDIDMFLCRYQADGSHDPDFGTNGHIVYDLNDGSDDMPEGMAIHQGKILACASAFNGNSSDYDALVLTRFNMDGSPDVTFGIGGFSRIQGLTISNMVIFPRTDLAVAVDNKIVVSGNIEGLSGYDFTIYRFLPNGYPDNTFDEDGMVVTDMIGANSPASVLIQPDGKIVAGGYHHNTIDLDFCLARYLDNGELDAEFGNYYGVSLIDISQAGFKNDQINSVALQPDGKIIAAGYATNSEENADFAIARYHSGLSTGFENNIQKEPEFRVFPNPVCDREINCQFFLQTKDRVEIGLYDYEGRKIMQWTYENQEAGKHIHFLTLPENIRSGNYILKLTPDEGLISTAKLVILL
ncbi:MAG: T9SS type A sorting domain-containing protein [Bacteroidales bacterium]|nr:T9SS type A sorting domain-containing protein [Bacteroidales bacterium]